MIHVCTAVIVSLVCSCQKSSPAFPLQFCLTLPRCFLTRLASSRFCSLMMPLGLQVPMANQLEGHREWGWNVIGAGFKFNCPLCLDIELKTMTRSCGSHASWIKEKRPREMNLMSGELVLCLYRARLKGFGLVS